MRISTLSIAAALLVTLSTGQAMAQTSSATPAVDGLLAAFQKHPLVGLGDAHGLAQEQDFYSALIGDPRFAREVGNIVVEFGGAAHQDIINRYVNGADVPYTELRKVWTDTVGWVPYPGYVGFKNVFAQVRAVNISLPPEQRIKVWLGEPSIDWSKVSTSAQLEPFLDQRDIHAAGVIDANILAKKQKALVIYGTTHFNRAVPKGATARSAPVGGSERAARKFLDDAMHQKVDPATTSPGLVKALEGPGGAGFKKDVAAWGPIKSMTFSHAYGYGKGDVFRIEFANKTQLLAIPLDEQGRVDGVFADRTWLIDLVEQKHPGSFFIATPYIGFGGKPCEILEKSLAHLAGPTLVPSGGLDNEANAAGCNADLQNVFADAMLYLGSGRSLQRASRDPDSYLDEPFRAELSRRNEIMTGRPLGPASVKAYPVVPVSYLAGQ